MATHMGPAVGVVLTVWTGPARAQQGTAELRGLVLAQQAVPLRPGAP